MLGITHLAAGAAIGALWGDRVRAPAAAVVAHGLLDIVGHDDDSVGLAGQAILGLGGVAALALAHGPASPVTTAGLAGAAPDAEVVVWMLRGRRGVLAFPSHWQRRGRAGEHPWQIPGRKVPVLAEIAVSLAILGVLCWAPPARRPRRTPG